MLLVAPDPRHGIAPERVRRIRRLLDGLPTAPGVAVALPGGPDGVLDALVLRPDGVLGLVPAGDRVPVPAGGTGGAQDRAAAEIDRLLALADPTPTAPRQVVPVVDRAVPDRADPERTAEDAGVGIATAASLVLTASSGPTVLDAAEVRRLFAAWRLAEFVPGPADLAAAGFEVSLPPGAVPSARSSALSNPGGPLARPETAPIPAAPAGLPAPGESPRLGSVPADTRRRRRARREVALPAWMATWRGLGIAAVAAFGVALGVAVLVVRGTGAAPEEISADPVRVVDGVTWTQRVVTTDPTCEGHAYGLAVQFLRERPCTQLDRALWTGDASGTPVLASVAVVRMHDAASAAALKSLVDSSGTGNVADLLREGRGYPGAPAGLSGAGYASTQLGESVVITETDATGGAKVPEATLDRIARTALGLR
ncbi:hypothetical protein [Actinomycetospora sp. NBRC 106378]|jgi:hypothetical protein|uniref:hypothetical protein n=1 Tax=Actinomycetospora sp. NBRC 106378 TaxID=3032208 RepID=UPI0024A4C5E2|nr:hypothetical protein [Actinomycetospora sp. NBRC 106378]GLZ55498.1 hypothetical protein Acsp07_51150 [Actinomycetospora sp. NBRC 106378]